MSLELKGYVKIGDSIEILKDDELLTNSERYITPELKEMEYKILNSKEQSIELESKLYAEIKNYLVSYIAELSEISSAVALADCLISFASVAADRNYVRPTVSNSFNHIKILLFCLLYQSLLNFLNNCKKI